MAFLKLVKIGDGLARQIGDELKTAFSYNAAPVGAASAAAGVVRILHWPPLRADSLVTKRLWPGLVVVHDSTPLLGHRAGIHCICWIDSHAESSPRQKNFAPAGEESPNQLEPGEESGRAAAPINYEG